MKVLQFLAAPIMGAILLVNPVNAGSHSGGMKIITAPGQKVSGPYSQAIKANGFLFLSGVVALNAKTKQFAEPEIKAQTVQVFENIKEILAAGGATLNDVVKVQVFLKNPADFKPMNEVYKTYFTTHKPTRTTVPGVDWGHPKIIIEIDIVAVVK